MSSEEYRRALEENGRQIREHFLAVEQERQEALLAMHPTCPVDGKPSDYLGMRGAFGAARRAFGCPDGHAFTYNRDNGQKRMIRPEDQRFIRRETFGSLSSTLPDESVESAEALAQNNQPDLSQESSSAQEESPDTRS